MRRAQAERTVRDSDLKPHERLVLLALLTRADNEDSRIPHWLSPSLTGVAHDTGLARSTVAEIVRHLEIHGWLLRDGRKPGQLKGSKQSGRGKSGTRWAILPEDFALPCTCSKPDGPPHGPSKAEMVRDPDHPDSPTVSRKSQVRTAAAPRDAVAREVGRRDHPGGPVPWEPEVADLDAFLLDTDDQ